MYGFTPKDLELVMRVHVPQLSEEDCEVVAAGILA